MATIIPSAPVSSELAAHLVRDPVSASNNGAMFSAQLAYLLGRALEHVACFAMAPLSGYTAAARIVYVQYRPSPGCRLVAFRVDVGPDPATLVTGANYSTDGKLVTLALTLPAGATCTTTAFNGVATLSQRAKNAAARQTYTAMIDLGAAGSVGDAIQDIGVTIAGVGAHTHIGFDMLDMVEIPLATLRPETSEAGMAQPWFDPRNDLHDGDGGLGQGFPTIITQEQNAATKVRMHWQVGTYELTTEAWFTASAVHAALNWRGGLTTTYDPVWRIRAKNTYGTSAGCIVTLRVRYNSTDAGELRIAHTPVGGALTRTVLTLPTTAGAWSTASVSVTLPATGTLQELDIAFDAKITSGTLYISSIALVGTEVA